MLSSFPEPPVCGCLGCWSFGFLQTRLDFLCGTGASPLTLLVGFILATGTCWNALIPCLSRMGISGAVLAARAAMCCSILNGSPFRESFHPGLVVMHGTAYGGSANLAHGHNDSAMSRDMIERCNLKKSRCSTSNLGVSRHSRGRRNTAVTNARYFATQIYSHLPVPLQSVKEGSANHITCTGLGKDVLNRTGLYLTKQARE